jgi:hypothetical protein
MRSKMRRHLAGPFVARDLGANAWQLSRTEPSPVDIFLRGADGGAAGILGAAAAGDVEIEWIAGAVLLTVTSGESRRTIRTQSAIVHEPLTQLYAALPLAAFDDRARRFWRRVFRLVRIPGGRHLLSILVRRGRG